jgi:hypothetical protein
MTSIAPSFRTRYESQIALSSVLRGLLPGHSFLLGGPFLCDHLLDRGLLDRGLLRSGFLHRCLLYVFLSTRFFRHIDSPLETFWHRNVSECIPPVVAPFSLILLQLISWATEEGDVRSSPDIAGGQRWW